jgi:hypothetical protein
MENKIIIFIPTGEFRKAKKGEYFNEKCNMLTFYFWNLEEDTNNNYFIYKKYEIEIPEKAETFCTYFLNKNSLSIQEAAPANSLNSFRLIKIKKWRWITNIDNCINITNYMTEEEIEKYCENYKNVLYYEKIEKSEIEY